MDRAAEVASEYHDGEVFSISGVSREHSKLSVNIAVSFGTRLASTPCVPFASPLRVRTTSSHFVYPDFMVVCGKSIFTDEHVDTLTNPIVVVEILSPSTADYDYGAKFKLYQRLPSLQEYILISQDQPRIDVYRKAGKVDWHLSILEGLQSVLEVQCLELSIPLTEIYSRIEFPQGT